MAVSFRPFTAVYILLNCTWTHFWTFDVIFVLYQLHNFTSFHLVLFYFLKILLNSEAAFWTKWSAADCFTLSVIQTVHFIFTISNYGFSNCQCCWKMNIYKVEKITCKYIMWLWQDYRNNWASVTDTFWRIQFYSCFSLLLRCFH